jgi:hypothetical protein
MKLAHIGLMIVFSTAAATASWGEAQPESRERFVCTFGAGQRFIDIYRLAARGPRGAGCRVDYTKNGLTKQVWSASGDYAYCVKKAVGLVTKLSKGNFSCKPQTSVKPESTPPEPSEGR